MGRVSYSKVTRLTELRAMFDRGEKNMPAANVVLEALGPIKQGCEGVLETTEHSLKGKLAIARTDKTINGKQIGFLNRLYAWGSATLLIVSPIVASVAYLPHLLTRSSHSVLNALLIVGSVAVLSVAMGFSTLLFQRIRSEKKTLEKTLKEIGTVRNEIGQAFNEIHEALALPTIV